MQESGIQADQTCPSCLIDQYVFDAQEIQKGIERRGSIFASKYDPSKEPDNFDHRDYLKIWRTFKIKCSRDIDTLEQLLVEFPEVAEEWNVKSALDRWEIALQEISRVPGCKYGETATMEQDHPIDTSESKAIENEDASATPSNDTGSKFDTSEDISNELRRQLDLWNVLPFAPLPRSALKGTRNTRLTSRLTFHPTSTIVASSTHPSYSAPHNKHTAAEFARLYPHYQRKSIEYRPALCSSAKGYAKEDTSGSSMFWYRYDNVH